MLVIQASKYASFTNKKKQEKELQTSRDAHTKQTDKQKDIHSLQESRLTTPTKRSAPFTISRMICSFAPHFHEEQKSWEFFPSKFPSILK
jgi:hypothetical protein